MTDVAPAPDRTGPESDEGPLPALLRALRTTPEGLGSREAARRLAQHGPNTLPERAANGLARQVLRQLVHPLALLLWLAAGLAFLTESAVVGWSVIGIVALNAVVAVLQERQATHAVEALEGYLPARARVRRDGGVLDVAAADLVPGDVVVVMEGDRVSADARILSGAVDVDASALTGESAPVHREAFGAPADRLLDAADRLFSGTGCIAGRADAVVTATGARTELGRIATLSQHARAGEESPLERQVRRATWVIAIVAVGVGVLFLPLGLLAGLSLPNAALFSVGLLVANVPEGLLPTITLALAIGVRVLARRGAVVKRLSAVETLGSTTVICTDKTGTLTTNRMRVAEVWVDGATLEPDDPAVPRALLEVLADCNQLEVSHDPMETALRDAAAAVGIPARGPVAVLPFDVRRRRMSVVIRTETGHLVETKGAPEQLLERCTALGSGGGRPMTAGDAAAVRTALQALTGRGLRVLAVAARRTSGVPRNADEAETGLGLLGLVALLDPPRPGVREAVAACHEAGIRVHVITGDNGATAAEIARQVGIRTARVISGAEADAMSEPELDALLAGDDEFVFARATPEGKLRIAEALKANGETVAMTGDGVNDAPALHAADIGVAMGRSGTDVARAAATMVLLDDDFGTIVAAIREGRRVYADLRKFVLYVFVHLMPEVVPFLVFALAGGAVPLPLTALQILAIDLGTELLPALALGREAAEPDVMRRRPRPRTEPLITRTLLVRAWGLMGVLSAGLALLAFFAVLLAGGWTPGAPTGPGTLLHGTYLQATSAAFAAIVVCQIGTAFAARTERASLASIGVLSNRPLLVAIGVELLFVVVLTTVPPLQVAFGTALLPLWVWAVLVPFPLLVWAPDELVRALRRRRDGDR
ncbi:cation-translocating P-type ATPase [Amnibacterium kyonggiense]|uniref:Calcium-translocating P-type ATPase n=1 Tax=Amnibacterium kyonggiense TaxID=595671 RepID=A0A4R7FKG1_9MICO|nr:cation-transporting P-type ATPase [Amnibacterium kyonggiense]TDS76843.1 calcium-translocating P-type ATPase [Amnibacterium kyonggiense]